MAQRIVAVTHTQAAKAASLLGQEKVTRVPVQIVASTEGPVTLWQKIKGWYKALIVTIGAVLTIIAQIAPFIPADDKHWVTTIIVVLTAIMTALKENEHWIDPTTNSA